MLALCLLPALIHSRSRENALGSLIGRSLEPDVQRIRTLKDLQTALRTSLRKRRGMSDYARWVPSDSLSAAWDSRTRIIATLIAPSSSVLEFGAGRLTLKDALPAGCTYTSSDLVSRGDGTIVCDLNSEVLPDFPLHDVVVFSGVLEYINDVPRLGRHLSRTCQVIVTSYAVVDTNRSTLFRRSCGWVNDFASDEFRRVFERVGLRCDAVRDWRDQKIFRFVRSNEST